MALRIVNKDIGIEAETHRVNNVSEREIKKMPVRDKIKPINIEIMDKSYKRNKW